VLTGTRGEAHAQGSPPRAQPAAVQGPQPGPVQAGEPAPPVGPTRELAAQPAPKKKHAMNSYAFGLQIGVGKVTAGDVTNPTYTPALVDLANQLTPAQMAQAGLIGTGCSPLDERCRTGSRFGVQLSLPIQLGGAGVGFRIEPTFNFAASAKSYGVYVGPTFSYRVLDPLYLGFGLGLKAAWVDDDAWKYGGDFQGRIPLTATFYVVDDVALVLEFAYGGGVSVFANESRVVSNPFTGLRLSSKTPEATFGLGRAWDVTVGVRFP
jgi:hypothetical protein